MVLDASQAAVVTHLAMALRHALGSPTASSAGHELADAIAWLHETAALDSVGLPLVAAAEVAVVARRLLVDEDAWEVSHEGRALTLTPFQYRLLRELVSAWGRTVPLPRLAKAMFGVHHAEQQRVTAHVKRLRKRLAEQGVDGFRIEAVRGIGFRLVECPQLVPALAGTHQFGAPQTV